MTNRNAYLATDRQGLIRATFKCNEFDSMTVFSTPDDEDGRWCYSIAIDLEIVW